MEVFETVLLFLLIADAIGLTVLVLMQQGKGADVGAAFGSGSANTVFGSAGAGSFLTQLTVWLAIGFFLITFGLAYTAKQRAGNVTIEGLPEIPADTAPVMPGLPEDLPAASDAPAAGAGSISVEGVDAGAAPGDAQMSDAPLTQDSDSVDSRVPEV